MNKMNSETGSDPILSARNIHKVYYSGNKQLEVLKGVNLAINEGEFTAMVGPSGAGKSTLMHILGGLDLPTKGEVIFEQKNIYGLSDAEISEVRNRKIGFVFQFYHLLSEFTVLENVVMPALINREEKRSLALELLEGVGLKERVRHFPSQLSGGEQQRAAIARALINKPSLLLCDEPTGNLDSAASEEVMALIQKINRENRMAVVLVTHNEELAKRAETLYHLKDGALF